MWSHVRRTHVGVFILTVGCILLAGSYTVSAATMSVIPVSGSSYAVGQLFSVSIVAGASAASPLNAVSGVLSYPADMVQIVSVDKSGSMINFWISEPAYSNASGRAQFEGGVYNPGFSGTQGRVITYVFKAKAAGTVDIGFANASILANDGQGSNILERTIPARLKIAAASQETTVVPESTIPAPGIAIRSATHPDQSAWYSADMVALTWDMPSDATGVRTGIDQNYYSNPVTVMSPTASETTITLKDGTWYFHVQVRDAKGWGPVSTFKINIDTAAVDPPRFDRFPSALTEGEVLLISGQAPAKSTVHMTLTSGQGDRWQQSAKASEDSRFQIVWPGQLEAGSYTLNAEVVSVKGLKSAPSQDVVIVVRPTALERVARPVIDYATIIALVAGIVFLCVLWVWYLIQHFRHFRRKVRADIKRTNQLIHIEFKKLLDRARGKRRLTAEEERMLSIIRESIHETEEEVEKDVRDIGQ